METDLCPAAMRLRQLAISQSVVFFAPPEVNQSILNHRKKTDKDTLDSYDVISWLLEQSCRNIEQLQPLYISQGLDFCRRQASAKDNSDAATDAEQREKYLQTLEQRERYSLKDLYLPSQNTKLPRQPSYSHPQLAAYQHTLDNMKHNLKDSSNTIQVLTHQEVETEREVEVEVETVREVKKPQHATPRDQRPLDRAVQNFANTGESVAGSNIFKQALMALRRTGFGQQFHVNDEACRTRLYVTYDFCHTVTESKDGPRDEYSRPVHWILWSPSSEIAAIVSDHEADHIIPLVRNQEPIKTHLICYAAPATRSMLVFDTLKFYSVPPLPHAWEAPEWLVRDLGIFAGRLYFDFAEQYGPVCEIMGLPLPPLLPNAATIERDSTVKPVIADNVKDPGREVVKPFSPNALLFMQEWLAVRNKGKDFSQTMMGEICRGRRVMR